MSYLTTKETAQFLGVSIRTLERWRQMGISPPYLKQGAVIRYALDELKEWAEMHKPL